jgi:hypothetical protein
MMMMIMMMMMMMIIIIIILCDKARLIDQLTLQNSCRSSSNIHPARDSVQWRNNGSAEK